MILKLPPPQISCVRKFSVDAGHRVFKHESKCANMHGHTYCIEAHARAPQLDSLGRVIDFSVLKERIGSWLDDNWDHGFLYAIDDHEVREVLNQLGTKKFEMPFNPTAENMALFLLRECATLLQGCGVEVFKVVVNETPNCRAEVTL